MCSAVDSHFSSHFKASVEERHSMDGLQFHSLSYVQRVGLVKPFSVEEVKAAVWDCGNFNCPGPD